MRLNETFRRAAGVAALAMLLAATTAVPALAAPVPWASVDISLIQPQGVGPVLLVAGTLPPGTKLPAEVELAGPKGIEPVWVGEILGTDPSKDPQATPQIVPAEGYDRILFTLKQGTKGQVEYDAANSLVADGQGKRANIEWVAPTAIPKVTLAVELPQGAKVTSATAGVAAIPDTPAYGKTFGPVKAGQKLSMSLSYTGGAVAPQQQPGAGAQAPAPAGNSSQTAIIVVVLGVLIGVAFFALKRAGGAPQTEAEVGDADDDDSFGAAVVEDDSFGAGDAFGAVDEEPDKPAKKPAAGKPAAKAAAKKPVAKKPAAKKPAKGKESA